MATIDPNSHEKLTKYEKLLFAPIWFYLPLFAHKIQFVSIFRLTCLHYHYLPIFGLMWH